MTDEAIRELGIITTKDDAGRHFTSWARYWEELENAGLIRVYRPVHEATEIPYSQEYWSLEVTEEGQQMVDDHPELWPIS
ncbi:MAG TPA: hypothetical protein VK171_03925 [Fimbriimonas sp.]|nr:hypothetical protein [Fimbriimonas sp.]